MKKNILIFGHSYCTPFADVNTQYSRLFDKNKYNVTLVYLIGEPDETIKQKHKEDEVIFLNCSRKTRRGLKISVIKTLLKLCREKNFEVVICHRYKPTYIMMWVNLFYKLPMIISIMHELGVFSHFFRKLVTAIMAPKNLIFAGVSDALRDDIRANVWRIPPQRVITLHNMIDAEFTETHLLDRETARRKLNLPSDVFLFGSMGRLVKNKNHKMLIDAFARIKSQCGNAKLVIMGNGALEDDLKNQVKQLKLENEIIFTGFIPNGFIYMKAFDVFILPSSQETFGRVLLEAMIAKVPIIASKVNGIPEVVGNTCPLVPSNDADKLSQEMLKAYSSSQSELYDWGQRCYKHATELFSFDRFNSIFWSHCMNDSYSKVAQN